MKYKRMLNEVEKEIFFSKYMTCDLGIEAKKHWIIHDFYEVESDVLGKNLMHIYKNKDELVYKVYY